MQRIAEEQRRAVGADWATVTVMEAKTGRLLAVADVPTIDPNDPARDGRGRSRFADVHRAVRARVDVQGRSPRHPSSTRARATRSAGSRADYRYLPPNGADINDSFFHGPTPYTLTGVLIDSSNTGMSMFGERLTDQQRYDDMLKFGLGERTEVGFSGEETGDLHGGPEEWDNQTKYATMFGQGLTTTAVQIASVYQTLANGGVRMPVSLVDGCSTADGETTKAVSEGTRVVSEKAADETTAMLERVYARRLARRQVGDPRLSGGGEDRNRAGARRPGRLPERLPRVGFGLRAGG